jgi:hypothetical protein
MWKCVLVLACLAGTARGDDDVRSLRIGDVEDATIADARLAIDGRHATLTLVLKTRAREGHEIGLGIDVPHGGAVTGMAMVQGRERTDATWLSPSRAHDEYTQIVEKVVDPALLEYVGGSPSHDHLSLRVYPISKVAPMTVELALELPQSDALEIEPVDGELPRLEVTVGTTHSVWRHVRAARRIALPEGAAHGYDPLLVRVDGHRSLYAEPHPVTLAGMPVAAPPGLRSAREIRAVVRAGAASLAACGDVEAHLIEFVIEKDGHVGSVVAGNACIEDAIRRWKFPAASDSTRIAYPLSWYVASGT